MSRALVLFVVVLVCPGLAGADVPPARVGLGQLLQRADVVLIGVTIDVARSGDERPVRRIRLRPIRTLRGEVEGDVATVLADPRDPHAVRSRVGEHALWFLAGDEGSADYGSVEGHHGKYVVARDGRDRLEALIAAFGAEDGVTESFLVKQLSQLQTAPRLSQRLLQDYDRLATPARVAALAGDPSAPPLLRRWCVEWLHRRQDERLREMLPDLVSKATDAPVRIAALHALVSMPSKDAPSVARDALDDVDPEVRLAAASVLGSLEAGPAPLEGPTVIEALAAKVDPGQDELDVVREASAWSLLLKGGDGEKALAAAIDGWKGRVDVPAFVWVAEGELDTPHALPTLPPGLELAPPKPVAVEPEPLPAAHGLAREELVVVGAHVAWLDFDAAEFSLDPFGEGLPEGLPSRAKARIHEVAQRDYATHEVQVFRQAPKWGRRTRIVVGGWDPDHGPNEPKGVYGQAEAGTKHAGHEATGLGSWRRDESVCLVFSDRYTIDDDGERNAELGGRLLSELRLGRAIGGTASHELGHVLGLHHPYAWDDWPHARADPFVRWHLMATGDLSTPADRVRKDRYMSQVSHGILSAAVASRAYYAPLCDVTGPDDDGKRRADLVHGTLDAARGASWYVRRSRGATLGEPVRWLEDVGMPGDYVFVADVGAPGGGPADGRGDLVFGHVRGPTSIFWSAHLSTGSSFEKQATPLGVAGHLGDVFRLADVTGDGAADLVYGRPHTAEQLTWYVRPRRNVLGAIVFDRPRLWRVDAGDPGDLVYLADVDGDGDADLITVRTVALGTSDGLFFDMEFDVWSHWFVRRSDGGSRFGKPEHWKTIRRNWRAEGGEAGDRAFVVDVDGDGKADLLHGRPFGHERMLWRTSLSSGDGWGPDAVVTEDAGSPCDYFRPGDLDGSGRACLLMGTQLWRPRETKHCRGDRRDAPGPRSFRMWCACAWNGGALARPACLDEAPAHRMREDLYP